jgi:hypothetical protein
LGLSRLPRLEEFHLRLFQDGIGDATGQTVTARRDPFGEVVAAAAVS